MLATLQFIVKYILTLSTIIGLVFMIVTYLLFKELLLLRSIDLFMKNRQKKIKVHVTI